MITGNDTTSFMEEKDLDLIGKTMKATGLPQAAVEALMMSDSDLDELCDTVLSQLAGPSKKASRA